MQGTLAPNPKYVRRVSPRKFEYGHIELDHIHRKHKHVPHGTETTMAEAMKAAGMAPMEDQ